MPNRILKESICTSDNLDMLTAFQETVFYRLIVNCDDYGRLDARPKILTSKLFPLKEIRVNQIEDALRALASAELVMLYEVDGKPFLQMKKWDKHQTIRNKKSKYPDPTAIESNCEQTQADSSNCYCNPIQSNPESNPESESESVQRTQARALRRFTPPTVDDVRAYCNEHGYGIDPEYFVDYYESNGWRVGKNPMRDWKACVRTWVKNEYSRKGGTTNNAVDSRPVAEEDLFAGLTPEQIALYEQYANDGEHYG